MLKQSYAYPENITVTSCLQENNAASVDSKNSDMCVQINTGCAKENDRVLSVYQAKNARTCTLL